MSTYPSFYIQHHSLQSYNPNFLNVGMMFEMYIKTRSKIENSKPIKCLTQDRRRRQPGGSEGGVCHSPIRKLVDQFENQEWPWIHRLSVCVCECYTTCLTKCFYFWVNESKKHFEFSVRAQKHDTSSSPLKQA